MVRSFAITVSLPFPINTSPGSVAATRRFTTSGRLANGIGRGSFRTDASFQVGSTGFACASSNHTWSVAEPEARAAPSQLPMPYSRRASLRLTFRSVASLRRPMISAQLTW
jgi:hypothetical protein